MLTSRADVQREGLTARYGGCIESPWDDIAIRYVLVTSHIARKRAGEAFNEQSQLVSCVTMYCQIFLWLTCLQPVFSLLYYQYWMDTACAVFNAERPTRSRI